MRRSLVHLAFLVMLSMIALAQPHPSAKQLSVSHEEEVVRTAYGKLSFAAQIGMLWHATEMHSGWPGFDDQLLLSKAMAEQIRFDISDVKIGQLNNVADRAWTYLVDGPENVLYVPVSDVPVSFTKEKLTKVYKITYADAAWKPEAQSPIDTHEQRRSTNQAPSIKQVLHSLRKANNGSNWTTYASYSVVATLRGRSISYRAAFLFSKNGENEEVLPLDYATAPAISRFVNAPMYPAALVDTVFREVPFVQAWIVANQITGCKKFGQPEVCCDMSVNRCGLAKEDVDHSLSIMIDPDMRSFLATRQKATERKKDK